MPRNENDLDQLIADLKDGKGFHGIDLSGRDLSYQTLGPVKLRGAILQKTSLLKSNLEGADLTAADLSGAFLIGASLSKACLEGANLRDTDLYLANLSGARLSRANLEKANLERANLRGADLTGANLRSANLKEADLLEAVLTDAELFGANLTGTNISPEKKAGINIYDRLLTISDKFYHWYSASSENVFYLGIALISASVAGMFGIAASILLDNNWVIPGSIAIGAVAGLVVAYGLDYFTDRAGKALTRRYESDETYSDILYRGDLIHANHLFRQGRYEDALEAFKEILAKAPDRVEPRFKIARIYQIGLNEPEKARNAYKNLLDLFAESLGENNMYVIESRRALKEL
jgi:tetratricopeptide (TPR) repeat protein